MMVDGAQVERKPRLGWRYAARRLLLVGAMAGLKLGAAWGLGALFWWLGFPATVQGQVDGLSPAAVMWLALLLAPLIETVVFQALPHLLIRPTWLYLLVSTAAFAATHPYGWLALAQSSLAGLVFAGMYRGLARRDGDAWPLLWVMLTHALFNLWVGLLRNWS